MRILVNYTVPITYTVVIDRDKLPDEIDLLDSITKDELVNGDGELTWDDIKAVWRTADPVDVIVTDENHNELYD